MQEEFPMLKEEDYQKEFLADWWSPRKLFIGERIGGKSTLMACELRRFNNSGMNTAFFAPNSGFVRSFKNLYMEMFGEQVLSDCYTFQAIREGKIRGFRYDAVVFDEFQEITFDFISQEIIPMNPLYFRASADKMKMAKYHYLMDEPGFFDSVYEI